MAELKLTIDANKALRDRVEVRTAERDAAVAHLRAVLDWSNTERFAGRTRHENDAPSSARSFLDGLDELQTSPKTSKDLDLCDECGCIGLCDPRCSLVPVQQDEPEGVCAFPNCSCTENRCPGVGGEPCRGCGVPTGVGAYHHIGCRTPEPNPVPVQQEPELSCEECPRTFRLSQHGERGRSAEMCPQCVADLRIEGRAGVTPVPSVGLRDRVLGIMGTQVLPDPSSLTVMKDAQRRPYSDGFRDGQIVAVNRLRPALSEALSVLHEAGTQEDEGEAFKSGYRAALIDCREALDSPKLALKWLEGRLVTFAPAPAVSGTPDTKEDEA